LGVVVGLSDQLLVGTTWSTVNLGDAIVLLTTVLLALFNVCAGTVLSRHRATTMVPIATAGGLVVLLGLAASDGALQTIPRLTSYDWVALCFCGTVGGAGVLLLWSWAIEHASAGRIAVFVAAAPISAAMTGSIVLSEPVTGRLLAGTVLIIAGIYLVYRAAPAAVAQKLPIGDIDRTRAPQST
jgi:drug/metabolite transporter (DMT)-like permease